jgi:hypothetical protein
MSDDRSPVDPRVVALLRATAAPSAAVRARARARLAMAIPGGMGGSSSSGEGGSSADGTNGAGAAGGAAVTGTWATHLVAIAAFVAGGGAGAAIYAGLSRPPPPAIVYVERPAPATSAPVAGPATADTFETAATARAPMLPTPHATTASVGARSATSPSRPSQLAAERVLLDEARAAFVQSDPERSLERLERHRSAFPNALLGEERDAMTVEALVRLGRDEEARAHAVAFRRRWPSSLFLPTVDSAVASIP